MAGLPASVVSRARQILEELEAEGKAPVKVIQREPDDQISMQDLNAQLIRQTLSSVNVETLTPIEAMNELYKLKKMLD